MRSVFETRPFGGWVAGTSRPETALMPVPLENPRWGLISDPPDRAQQDIRRTVVPPPLHPPLAPLRPIRALPHVSAQIPSHSRRRGSRGRQPPDDFTIPNDQSRVEATAMIPTNRWLRNAQRGQEPRMQPATAGSRSA